MIPAVTTTAPDLSTDPIHRPGWGPWMLVVPLLLALVLRNRVALFDDETLRLWSTLFVSISVQALPFLVLGVTISGAIVAFVSPDLVRRLLPNRPSLAVPVAGIAGVALPGCECGSVPIAGRLISGGSPPAAALYFLLSAPAINPVVLIATAVAFPGQPQVVGARFGASLVTALVMGWLWTRSSRLKFLGEIHTHDHGRSSRLGVWTDAAARDLVHAGGYLVLGAFAAATLQIIVPRNVLDTVVSNEALSIAVMAGLAVLLSICSEADAFVAAGLPQFSLTSRLVFMVVGPVVDLKLIALQGGILGKRFTMHFAPMSLVVAIAAAVVFGMVLL